MIFYRRCQEPVLGLLRPWGKSPFIVSHGRTGRISGRVFPRAVIHLGARRTQGPHHPASRGVLAAAVLDARAVVRPEASGLVVIYGAAAGVFMTSAPETHPSTAARECPVSSSTTRQSRTLRREPPVRLIPAWHRVWL